MLAAAAKYVVTHSSKGMVQNSASDLRDAHRDELGPGVQLLVERQPVYATSTRSARYKQSVRTIAEIRDKSVRFKGSKVWYRMTFAGGGNVLTGMWSAGRHSSRYEVIGIVL